MNSHFTHDAARAIHEARIAELKASAQEVRYQRHRGPLVSLRRIFSAEYVRMENARLERNQESIPTN